MFRNKDVQGMVWSEGVSEAFGHNMCSTTEAGIQDGFFVVQTHGEVNDGFAQSYMHRVSAPQSWGQDCLYGRPWIGGASDHGGRRLPVSV